MDSIRVILADDHTLLRAGLRALIDALPGIDVVGEAADAVEALALVETLRPDVVLMDITMPGMSGLDATARIKSAHPDVRVVMLSMHKNDAYVQRAILAGASGYLVKDSDTEELGLALRAVAGGMTYLSPSVSTHLVSEYRRQAGPGPASGVSLTRRQAEVLQLVAQGNTTKAIANRLGISIKTVESHRAQLMERLDIHDMAGLVRYAIRHGLVTPES